MINLEQFVGQEVTIICHSNATKTKIEKTGQALAVVKCEHNAKRLLPAEAVNQWAGNVKTNQVSFKLVCNKADRLIVACDGPRYHAVYANQIKLNEVNG